MMWGPKASPLLTTPRCLTAPLFSRHLNTSILNMINEKGEVGVKGRDQRLRVVQYFSLT